MSEWRLDSISTPIYTVDKAVVERAAYEIPEWAAFIEAGAGRAVFQADSSVVVNLQDAAAPYTEAVLPHAYTPRLVPTDHGLFAIEERLYRVSDHTLHIMQ